MKTQKKPPLKFKPAPRKPPAPQPKPAAIAATASQPESKSLDDIRIEALEHRMTRFFGAGLARVDYRINSLEQRVNGIADDVKRIYYALGQLAELAERSGHPLNRLDLERATDAEKSGTQ